MGLVTAVAVVCKERGRFQWALIKQDPRWAQVLARRSNVDLQNRWQNMRKRDKLLLLPEGGPS